MFRNLSPGAVGVSGSPEEIMTFAKAAGFQGVDPVGGLEPDDLRALYGQFGLQVGVMGLPVDFRKDQATYEAGLAKLPAAAKHAAALGCTRCATWLSPTSDELTYLDNFRQHAQRLRSVAKILADFGMRFGLEYVGPKTSWSKGRYPFVHTMPQLLELCGAVGTGNMGLLLDCWHWYTASETVDDLKRLDNTLIIQVHVNDAPVDVDVDDQMDNVRDLPGATGVIDIAGFLQALESMGYDGPVTPEPFKKELREMTSEDAAQAAGTAMQSIWKRAGIAD